MVKKGSELCLEVIDPLHQAWRWRQTIQGWYNSNLNNVIAVCSIFMTDTFRQKERSDSDFRSNHRDTLDRHGTEIERLNQRWIISLMT